MFCHERYSLFLSERTNGTIVSSCIPAYPIAVRRCLQISDELFRTS
jgi:hypothetical protein